MESEGSVFPIDPIEPVHNPPHHGEPVYKRPKKDKVTPPPQHSRGMRWSGNKKEGIGNEAEDRDSVEISEAGREALEAYKNQDQENEE